MTMTGVLHDDYLVNMKPYADLHAEAQPGLTVPTLLGSCWRANIEPSESWQNARG